jgi:hypothetical protein
MFLEDYTTAINWRIGAILLSVGSLFSVSIVIWYLIFRENPNLPDETDQEEKERFRTEQQSNNNDKHNLMSEIVGAFKNFPSIGFTFNYTNSDNQNFFQRLCYVMFGSANYYFKEEKNMRSDFKFNKNENVIRQQPSSIYLFLFLNINKKSCLQAKI